METQYFERPAGTLAYSDYGGNGPVVLMLPGMGALRSEYRFLAPQLAEAGYHAVTVDLRGHGESSVPWDTYDVPSVGKDILALIDHLGSNPVHIIGTSFAPAGVVWAAAESPDCVRSLVLISPFVRDVPINPIMNALFWLMMHNPWRVQMWGKYYGTLYPTHKPADYQEYLQQLVDNLKQPGRMDAADALANSARQPSAERLSQVKALTLVIMGTKDPDFPDPVAEGQTVAAQTHGTVEFIEDAGHYPQTEMPEKTVPIIVEFLKQAAA